MSASGYVHLEECEILRVSEKAMLLKWEGTQHWIPLTQIADADNYEAGDKGVTVSITEWIAEQKGIEVDE